MVEENGAPTRSRRPPYLGLQAATAGVPAGDEPVFPVLPPGAGRVVFVLDVSAAMAGALVFVHRALARACAALPRACAFNVVAMGSTAASSASQWRADAVPRGGGGGETVAAAMRWLASLGARGSCDLLAGLRLGLADPAVDTLVLFCGAVAVFWTGVPRGVGVALCCWSCCLCSQLLQ